MNNQTQVDQSSAMMMKQVHTEIADFQAKLESAKQRRQSLLDGVAKPRSFSRTEHGKRETVEMAVLEIGGYIARIELILKQLQAKYACLGNPQKN